MLLMGISSSEQFTASDRSPFVDYLNKLIGTISILTPIPLRFSLTIVIVPIHVDCNRP